MNADDPAVSAIPDCPYRGLESFDEKEREYFFGREQETKTIGANLITSRLTIFYGASGVGKTSVLRAGVMPFVRKQSDVTAILFRSWREATFELQLKQELANEVKKKSGADLDPVQPFDRCLAEAAVLTRGTIVVIFDQFEEYMLYHAASSGEGREFDSGFACAVNRPDIDANFLISIREDALARLDRFRRSVPDLLGNRLRLDHLDSEGARAAIRKPLVQYDAIVRAHGRNELVMNVEDDLVEELIRQVRIGGVGLGLQGRGHIEGAAAVTRVETPFLQMVLEKMWEAERRSGSQALRLETLRTLGGAQTIVREHVNGVMQRLTSNEREAASQIFDRLVTPSGSKIAYKKSDLEQFAGKARAAAPLLLGTLTQMRILRELEPAGTDDETRYEIFHDVLSTAVLEWRTRYHRERELVGRVWKAIGIAVPLVIIAAVMAAMYVRSVRSSERYALMIRSNELRIAKANAESSQRREELALANNRLANQREEALKLVVKAQTAVTLSQQMAKTEAAKSQTAIERQREETRRSVADAEARESEKSATSFQNAGNLAEALSAWKRALEIYAQQKNEGGAVRANDAIGKILREQERQADERLQDAESDEVEREYKDLARMEWELGKDKVPDLDPGPVKRCKLIYFDGDWKESTPQGSSIWTLWTERKEGVTHLKIVRKDITASGTLTRENSNATFTGTITYRDGSSRKVTIPYPDGASGCQRITGSGISLTRETYGRYE